MREAGPLSRLFMETPVGRASERHPAMGTDLAIAALLPAAPYFLTPSSSTSKINVAFGGMTPPAPRAP